LPKQGEKFQFVSDTRFRGWFNVVDATTQHDYGLPGNAFKIVEDTGTESVVLLLKIKYKIFVFIIPFPELCKLECLFNYAWKNFCYVFAPE
jgi:hypothetical protein